MTAETARNVMKILRGSYPNDAWKLDGQNAEEFIGAMMLQLERYSDGDVLRAVGRVIDSADTMPSVTMIKKEVKRKINAVPDYQALPEAPVNEAGRKRIHDMISGLRSQWKRPDKEKKPPSLDDVPKDIIEFARRAVPGIPDELIIKNAPVFKEGMACNMRMYSLPMRFWLDPNTGLVSMTIVMKTRKGGVAK